MSQEITVRRERADHPQVVATLAALDDYLLSLYPPEANHVLSVQELLAPEVSFFAAWHGDRVVGTGAVRRLAGETATAGEAYGEIKRMFVDPALRGQRLGRRLIEAIECDLLLHDVRLALLETGEDQHEAIRLYQRCGYQRRAAFGGYPENGLSVFMQRCIGA